MNPARLSIRNPVLVNLITVLVIVAGLVVYATLIRKEVFPPAEVGIVLVSAFKPGSPPEDVKHELTIPLEREVRDLRELEELISVSGDGFSQLVLRFEGDVDIERALVDVQSRIARARLPAEVEPPRVREVRIPMPLKSVAVSVTPEELERMQAAVPEHELAEDGVPFALERRIQEVARTLERRLLDEFPGLDDIALAGMRERELQVRTDPDKLRQHGLTLNELATALAAANARIPPGVLKTEEEEIAVRASAPLVEDPRGLAHAAEGVIVRSAEGGRSPLRLGRVATVVDGFEDLAQRGRFYTEQIATEESESLVAVTLTLYKQEEADFLRLADQLEPYLEEYAQQLASEQPGIEIVPFADRSQIIRDRLATVEHNGLIGLLVVVLVLFLFLHYRIALLAALGIPIALLGSMIVLWSLGFSANILSLFGLIIALGLVVDDAIIVAENAYRYIEQGMSPVAAALKGTKDVLGPVIAAVLTTVAAFSPLLAWGGVTGQFLAAIPIAVVAALAISLIECLFLLPSHVAEWAHDPRKQRRPGLGVGRVFDVAFAWTHPLRRGFNRLYRKLVRVYSYVLVRCLRLRYLTLVAAMLVFAASLWVLAAAGTTFIDFRQVERFHINLTLPEGTPIEEVGRVTSQVERVALEEVPPHTVATISTTLGRYRDPSHVTRTAKNVAEVIVEFRTIEAYRDAVGEEPPEDYRLRDNVERYFAQVRNRLDTLALSEFHVYAYEGGPPEGAPVEILLRGDEHDAVVEASETIRRELRELRGLRDISSTSRLGGGEYRPRFDREELAALGLTEREVGEALRAAVTGRVATRITRAEEEIDVVVKLTPEASRSREELLAVEVVTPAGRVPLSSLIEGFERSVGASSVRRVDHKTAVTVSAEVDGITARDAVGLARPIVNEVLERHPGVEASYEGRFGAEAQGFTELGFFSLLALGLIYTILATVLRSFVQPFLIMAAIPLGFVGVALGLYVMGEKFSLVSAIGAVALMGIIVNDSTILLHFANKQRRAGVNRWRAIVRASRIRLRPILLTTLTTIAGLFSISYAHYFGGYMGNEAFLAPMGVAISWGLAFGTLLLMLVVPCLFAVYEDLLAWLRIDPRRDSAIEAEIDRAIAAGVDTARSPVDTATFPHAPGAPRPDELAPAPHGTSTQAAQPDSGSYRPVDLAPTRLLAPPVEEDAQQADLAGEPAASTTEADVPSAQGASQAESAERAPRSPAQPQPDADQTQTAIEPVSGFEVARTPVAPPDPGKLWLEEDDEEPPEASRGRAEEPASGKALSPKRQRPRTAGGGGPAASLPSLPPKSGSSGSLSSGEVRLDPPPREPTEQEESPLSRSKPEPSVSYPPTPSSRLRKASSSGEEQEQEPNEPQAPGQEQTEHDVAPPKPSEILKRRQAQAEASSEAAQSGPSSDSETDGPDRKTEATPDEHTEADPPSERKRRRRNEDPSEDYRI